MAGFGRLSVLLALPIVACGGSGSSPQASAAAPPQSAQTLAVQLDGSADAFHGAFTGYFPNTLSVHPGDTVSFKLPHFSGEPHTVTVGTLVDAAVAKLRALGPQASVAAQENSPEMLNFVDVFPHAITGPPDANQSAASPGGCGACSGCARRVRAWARYALSLPSARAMPASDGSWSRAAPPPAWSRSR
jgi:plastocyanin